MLQMNRNTKLNVSDCIQVKVLELSAFIFVSPAKHSGI